VEVDVADDVSDTNVLMISYVKDNISQSKAGYLILVVWFIYVPRMSCSTSWLQKRKG